MQVFVVLMMLIGSFLEVPRALTNPVYPDTGGPPANDVMLESSVDDDSDVLAPDIVNAPQYSINSITLAFYANPPNQSFKDAVRIERCGTANYEWLAAERIWPDQHRFDPWDKGSLSGCEGSYPFINWKESSTSIGKICAGFSDSKVSSSNFFDHPNNRCYRVWRVPGGIGQVPIFDIAGKVTDINGNALSGVTISLSNGQSTTTNSNGNYRFDNIDKGTYTVTASKSGYVFTPASRSVTGPRQPLNTKPDITGQNFSVPFAQPVDPPQPPPGGSCPIPFYWQKDPRWKNHPLRTGGYGNCSSRCNTIGKCGCTLTSATMIYDYFGANTTRQGKTMNPANLSDCMGKYACPFTWNTGTRCANNKVSFNRYSFSWSRLERELAKGRLVMLLLQRSNGATHYVVAVSGSGNSARGYRVHDPALKQGTRMRLSDVLARRNYRIVNMRSYSGTPDCQVVNVSNMNTPEPTFALSAMNPITGSAVIYRNTEITMTFEMAAESINGDVTEMLIWTDSISNTIWQPFAEYIAIPLSEQLFVQFRDNAGTVSGVISDFSDPVEGPPDLSLVFLPLILREQ